MCWGGRQRPAPVPIPGAGSRHPRALCPLPGLAEVQVGAGFSAYLPVCEVWMTLETEAVLCLQLSAAVIVSAQGLLGDPHKVPRPLWGLPRSWKWEFTQCSLTQMAVLGAGV